MITQEKLQRLNTAVREVLTEIEGGEGLWNDTTREWMVEVLADSIIRRASKFARGQKEHGGDFLTKDMKIVGMIQEESDDSFWYFERLKHDLTLLIQRNKKYNTPTINPS